MAEERLDTSTRVTPWMKMIYSSLGLQETCEACIVIVLNNRKHICRILILLKSEILPISVGVPQYLGLCYLSYINADTPQFRGRNPYFSVKICINPYPPSMYRENVHAIHIEMQFAKKSRHCVIKIDIQQQRTKIGALRMWRDSRIRHVYASD